LPSNPETRKWNLKRRSVMHSSVLKRVRIAAMLFLVLGVASTLEAQNPPNWQVGDVVVCFGTGTCNVLRNTNNTNAGLVLISQVSDGFTGAGATNGAAINNTLHLLMTDAGITGSNGSNIVEYTIANVDPFTGAVIPHTVVTTFDGSNGGTSSNIQAVVLDSKGDMFVGNASPATIVELNPGGSTAASFTVPGNCIDSQLASLDLSSNGTTLYFTSGGGTIRQVSVPFPAALDCTQPASKLADFGPGVTLSGIRVLPAGSLAGVGNCMSSVTPSIGCPSGGFLVVATGMIDTDADSDPFDTTSGDDTNVCTGTFTTGPPGYCVLLLDSTGNIVVRYPITGQTTPRALTLDPLVADCTGGCSILSSPTVSHFWVGDSASAAFSQVAFADGTSTAFDASSCTGCGTVSNVQSLAIYGGEGANQPDLTKLFSGVVNSGAPTQTVNFPLPMAPADTNTMTVTVFNLPPGDTTLALYASLFPNASAQGASDGGVPCEPTTSVSTDCIVWKVDIDVPNTSTVATKFKAPTGIDINTDVFVDEHYDVTTFVGNFDPGGGRISVHSLHEVTPTAPAGGSCVYTSPAPKCFQNPGNLTFKFACSTFTGDVSTLVPRLSLVTPPPGTGPNPKPLLPLSGTGTNGANYRFNGTQWLFNWQAQNGVIRATTVDLSHQLETFFEDITVANKCPGLVTISLVTPKSGSVSGTTNVTITGTGFAKGATVTFGGVLATNPKVASNGKSITAITPAHAAGPVDVTVTNLDGGTATLAGGYTYKP